jgi:hypothetical protein
MKFADILHRILLKNDEYDQKRQDDMSNYRYYVDPETEAEHEHDAGSMELGSKSDPGYFASLNDPCGVINAKVPGQTTATVSLKRVLNLSLTTSTGTGGLFIYIQPASITDNISNGFTVGTVNSANYDPFTGALQTLAVVTPMNLQAGVVQAYRLVSASAVLSPVSSFNTASGLMHGCLYSMDGLYQSLTAGGGAIGLCPPLSSIQSNPYYQNCQALLGNNLEVTWQPNDIKLLQMKAINTNYQTGETTFTENVMLFYVTGGINAGIPLTFNLTLTLNLEVTPAIGSVLTGIESISAHNENPERVWRERLVHGTVVRSYNDSAKHKHRIQMQIAKYENKGKTITRTGKALPIKPYYDRYQIVDEDERKLIEQSEMRNAAR